MANINEGWIKLFSKFTEWEWYKDSNTTRLFIHCLLKANWKEGKFQGIDVPRGSFVTGRKQLSEELGISEQSIRTSLNKLKSTNEITIKSTNKFTLITIVNYEKYQKRSEQLTNELTNNSTNEQPTTNQQNREKCKISTNKSTNTFPTKILKRKDIGNQQINQQLTNKKEKKVKNQPQYKTIDIYSVCNNTHAREENFKCHLGSEYKTESCFYCLKKNICPNNESYEFVLKHNKTFDEWNKQVEDTQKEMIIKKQPGVELFDYDWINNEEEK